MAAEKVVYELSLNDLLSGKIRNANDETNRLEGSMSGLQGTIGKVGAAIGVAFGINAIKNFAMSMVEAGTTVENAQTGLTTLLKDSDEASGVIKNTMEDATKTPFAFEGLLAANKALISAGVSSKQAREDVLNLSNAIAATGGGDDELQRMVVNMQQIKNIGKATAQDIKQFGYAGINIYKVLADATHQPIEKVKDMEVSYDNLTMALKKAHAEGGIYYHGLENMAGNTSVQISNLGDAMFQLKNKMFTDLKPAITATIQTLFGLIEKLREGWEWFKRNSDTIIPLVKTVSSLWFAFKAASILTGVVSALRSLTLVMYEVTTATTAFEAAMVTALGPVGLLVAALGALAFAYYSAGEAEKNLQRVHEDYANVVGKYEEEAIDKLILKYEKLGKSREDALLWSLIEEKKKIQEELEPLERRLLGMQQEENNSFWFQSLSFTESEKEKLEGNIETLKARLATTATYTGKSKVAKTKGNHDEPVKDLAPKGATGQKVVTINISIAKMIETFKISTANIQESSSKVRELVAQTLLSAVSDSQITAGI
jgi:tape measure domain-containing protein